ncbi:MAG: type II secretion system protein GspG [bacterium]
MMKSYFDKVLILFLLILSPIIGNYLLCFFRRKKHRDFGGNSAVDFKKLFVWLISIIIALLIIEILYPSTPSNFYKRIQVKLTVIKLTKISKSLKKYKEIHNELPADLYILCNNLQLDNQLIYDAWGELFCYIKKGNNKNFILFSKGSDKKEKTKDDIFL